MPAIDEIEALLGPQRVLKGEAVPARNRADASGLVPTVPAAVVMPHSTEEVSRVLAICHRQDQPVVMQGGMTGLAGGAHPQTGELALSLERMVGVEEVDASAATLTALAGTPLQVVQDAAEAAGFMCGIDLGARGSCSIGGNIATNAGGNQVLRYGMARKNVLGLEAVLADGTVVRSLNKMLKNNAGYDWTQLFIGSEGTLGVVTRVVLGLHPKPVGVHTALCTVTTFADALKVLRRFEREVPGGLLVFEAMWKELLDIAVAKVGLAAPFAFSEDIALLIEAATGEGEAGRSRFEDILAGLYEAGLVKQAVVAKSKQDADRLWAFRESMYEFPRLLPPGVGFDISLPRARIGEAVAYFREGVAARWPQSHRIYFGHVADSNLHLTVMQPGIDAAGKKKVEEFVYDGVSRFAGSISAEHGIGRNKRPYLALSRTAPELALMRTIKQALDPKGILNPGRVI